MQNEPDGTPNQPAAPTQNQNANDNPRNVSYQDFQQVLSKLNGLESVIKNGSQQPTAQQPEQANTTQTEPVSPEVAKIIEENKRYKAENIQRDLTQAQTAAAAEAKVDLGDLAPLLLGKDEDTTKANVKAFSDYMTAHDEALKKSTTPSTDNGFNATQTNSADSKSVLSSMMDDYFQTNK